MENVGLVTRKKLLKDEKLIRSVDYDSWLHCGDQKDLSKLLLDLEILHGDPSTLLSTPQKVIVTVTVKSRVPQVLTLFKKDHYSSDSIVKKPINTSGTKLSTSNTSKNISFRIESRSTGKTNISPYHSTDKLRSCQSCGLCKYLTSSASTHETKERWSKTTLEYSQLNILGTSNLQCPVSQSYYVNTGRTVEMDSNKNDSNLENGKKKNAKSDKATLIITNTSSEESMPGNSAINQLSKRIDSLEQKVLHQELVFRNNEKPNSSKKRDETTTNIRKNSYVEHYSHIPESSGFQRLPRLPPSPSISDRKTIDKTHNSEQYGRDFTTYDGITDTRRRRRQSASMPLNRCEALNVNPVLRSRTKHNTVRDYRLMDTVHYLAQGEFAPRNDGIKLTSSREAVLSDIIWEDVCRSHWPSARLTRRGANSKRERSTHRNDLQRQIDTLLQDRITHSEKRRRRHYRVMKMNQGNSSNKTFGKTGDVIVASNRSPNLYQNVNNGTVISSSSGSRQAEPGTSSTCRRSGFKVAPEYHGHRCERNSAGPSTEVPQKPFQECALANLKKSAAPTAAITLKSKDTIQSKKCRQSSQYDNSAPSSDVDSMRLCPKLIVGKKEPIRRKPLRELRPSKEHYILLPTLVVKTSSHFGRQRKYNELYRALKNDKGNSSSAVRPTTNPPPNQVESTPKKGSGQHKDIGLNVNIRTSTSDESLHE